MDFNTLSNNYESQQSNENVPFYVNWFPNNNAQQEQLPKRVGTAPLIDRRGQRVKQNQLQPSQTNKYKQSPYYQSYQREKPSTNQYGSVQQQVKKYAGQQSQQSQKSQYNQNAITDIYNSNAIYPNNMKNNIYQISKIYSNNMALPYGTQQAKRMSNKVNQDQQTISTQRKNSTGNINQQQQKSPSKEKAYRPQTSQQSKRFGGKNTTLARTHQEGFFLKTGNNSNNTANLVNNSTNNFIYNSQQMSSNNNNRTGGNQNIQMRYQDESPSFSKQFRNITSYNEHKRANSPRKNNQNNEYEGKQNLKASQIQNQQKAQNVFDLRASAQQNNQQYDINDYNQDRKMKINDSGNKPQENLQNNKNENNNNTQQSLDNSNKKQQQENQEREEGEQDDFNCFKNFNEQKSILHEQNQSINSNNSQSLKKEMQKANLQLQQSPILSYKVPNDKTFQELGTSFTSHKSYKSKNTMNLNSSYRGSNDKNQQRKHNNNQNENNSDLASQSDNDDDDDEEEDNNDNDRRIDCKENKQQLNKQKQGHILKKNVYYQEDNNQTYTKNKEETEFDNNCEDQQEQDIDQKKQQNEYKQYSFNNKNDNKIDDIYINSNNYEMGYYEDEGFETYYIPNIDSQDEEIQESLKIDEEQIKLLETLNANRPGTMNGRNGRKKRQMPNDNAQHCSGGVTADRGNFNISQGNYTLPDNFIHQSQQKEEIDQVSLSQNNDIIDNNNNEILLQSQIQNNNKKKNRNFSDTNEPENVGLIECEPPAHLQKQIYESGGYVAADQSVIPQGKRPPSRHKVPPKAVGLGLPQGEQIKGIQIKNMYGQKKIPFNQTFSVMRDKNQSQNQNQENDDFVRVENLCIDTCGSDREQKNQFRSQQEKKQQGTGKYNNGNCNNNREEGNYFNNQYQAKNYFHVEDDYDFEDEDESSNLEMRKSRQQNSNNMRNFSPRNNITHQQQVQQQLVGSSSPKSNLNNNNNMMNNSNYKKKIIHQKKEKKLEGSDIVIKYNINQNSSKKNNTPLHVPFQSSLGSDFLSLFASNSQQKQFGK